MESRVLSVIDEQLAVEFTGKVNILSSFNHQFLGHILFIGGDVIQVIFLKYRGIRAFYELFIQEYALQSFDYVIEPELVEEKERKIHYPYSILKQRLREILRMYRETVKFKPPDNIKIILDADFLEDSLPITSKEFDVLRTLADWNNPSDLYQQCELMEHEVTQALISLRKKGALKILAPRKE